MAAASLQFGMLSHTWRPVRHTESSFFETCLHKKVCCTCSCVSVPWMSVLAIQRNSWTLLNLNWKMASNRMHDRFWRMRGKAQVPSIRSSSSRAYCQASLSSTTRYSDARKLEEVTINNEPKYDTDVLIECRNIHKSFGEKHVLRGVSFKIRHGEAVGIIGPSGTGKSTILKIMAGLLAPDKGDLYICGKKRHGLISDEELSGLRIGLVFQSAALFDSLTVRENVGFMLYEQSNLPMDRIAELVTESLEAVGLKGVEDRMPAELSGGMKKRVALARAIIFDDLREAAKPEVVMYDEPTAGLDPIASTVVEDLIRSVHIKGRDAIGKPGKIASYIVVTHQHSTIQRAVDRLLFLHEGKIVWEGSTHDFHTSSNSIVRQVVWMGQSNTDGYTLQFFTEIAKLIIWEKREHVLHGSNI